MNNDPIASAAVPGVHRVLLTRANRVMWVVLLALPLSLGWHPVPTLGTIAEALAVAVVACAVASLGLQHKVDLRTVVPGSCGVLALLVLTCLLQPLRQDAGYAAFWVGPVVVLATALGLALVWRPHRLDLVGIVAWAVLLAASVNAVVGFAQYWRFESLLDPLTPSLVYWDRNDPVAHGNVAQRNILSTLCLLGVAASIYLREGRATGWIAWEMFLIYVATITASRTALLIVGALGLGLLVGGIGKALRSPTMRWIVAPALALQWLAPPANAAIASLSGIDLPVDAMSRVGAEGIGIRSTYFRLAWEIGLQHPILGVGWRGQPAAMVEQGYSYGLWGVDEMPSHAHNLFLQLWAETGPLPALLTTGFLLRLAIRRPPTDAALHWAWVTVVALLAHSAVEFPLWHPAMLFLFVVAVRTMEGNGGTGPPGQGVATRTGWALRAATGAVALGASVTVAQLVLVANQWRDTAADRADVAQQRWLGWNPVIAPYRDWIALNVPGQLTGNLRIETVERVAAWLPDSHVLAMLRDAYLAAGQTDAARQIQLRRQVVFGVPPGD